MHVARTLAPAALLGLLTLGCSDSAENAPPPELDQQENRAPTVKTVATALAVPAGSEAILDASAASDPDGDELTFLWSQAAGPEVTLDDPTAATPRFDAPMTRTALVFTVAVSDGTASVEATITVNVTNQAPIATVTAPATVEGGSEVTLNGGGSSDVDGHALTYAWTQTGGTAVELSDPTAAAPSFVAPAARETLAFRLVVSDGLDESAPAMVEIAVANNPPVADAGPDQTVDGGIIVSLDGTGSSDLDGDPLTYQWTLLADEADQPIILLGSDGPDPSFVAPIARGTVSLQLVVSDGALSSQADSVTISVGNNPPVADAGADQVVKSGAVIKLNGAGSSDLDGDALTYQWAQVAGPTVVLNDATTPTPTFTAPAGPAALAFELVVNDGLDPSVSDSVQISVDNAPPLANAGPDVAAQAGEQVTLDATGSSDPDGDALTYEWTRIEGADITLSDPSSATPSFTAPEVQGTISFHLIVHDGTVASASDVVKVHVNNLPPVANAGSDQVAAGGDTVVLDASGSSDPEGKPLTYQWTQVAGTPIGTSQDGPTLSFVAPQTKVEIRFELVVSDAFADSEPDPVSVHVNNQVPVADAGNDHVAPGGAAVTLDGSGSSDPDGDPLSYQWSQVGGTPVLLSDPKGAKPTFTAPPGSSAIEFQLVASDGITGSVPDTVLVHVDNEPPEAKAADTALLASKGDTVVLDGSPSTDADGDALSWEWTQLGGTEVELSPSGPEASFVAPFIADQLRFGLRVFDGLAWSAPIEVIVHVGNTPPVAHAGKAQVVDPGDLVTLNGTGSSDAEGDTLSWEWTQVAGMPVDLAGATTAEPTFTAPDMKGSLTFELVVDDGLAASQPATVTISVSNIPPAADAGPDQVNVEHGAIVALSGADSSDLDGDELTYAWTQVAGPAVSLSDPTSPSPTFLAPATKATLGFELVVNDGLTPSAPDTVTVSTRNTPPEAVVSGPSDVEGGTEVALDGTASSDDDGDTLAFAWTQVEGPEVPLQKPNTATPIFVAPIAKGTLVFELVVSDGEESSAPATHTVVVQNNAPKAQAGADQEVAGGTLVLLDGAGSTDADDDALTFGWAQLSGPAIALDDPTSESPGFTAPVARGVLVLELTVTDPDGAQDSDTVTISVQNNPPVAATAADQEVAGGTLVVLNGSSSSDLDDDALTYAWTQVAGKPVSLSDATAVKPSFAAPATRGELVFELVVHDGDAASAPATTTVTVLNNTPVADAGPPLGVEPGELVTLDGGASSDLDGDSLTWSWTQLEGTPVDLKAAGTSTPSFAAPQTKGLLRFQLIVSDGEAESAPSTVDVSVANNPPVAHAGPDQSVQGGAAVTLDGSASADPDGDELSWAWTQISGAPVSLTGAKTASPTFIAPESAQDLVFELVVSDGTVASAEAMVTITIENNAPVADAGEDQAVEGTSTVTLDGSGSSDADGDPLLFSWTQIAGEPVLLDDASSATPAFDAPLVAQVLTFRLIVDDGKLKSAADTVQVVIENHPPLAHAGKDQLVDGGTLVILSAADSSDVDDDELTYQWTQIAGPAVTLSDDTSATPEFTAPVPRATFVFELVVNDGTTDSAPDETVVTIKNHAPEADAGVDQTVDGGTIVSLDGAASDLDTDPLTLKWTQVGGQAVLLDDPKAAAPSFKAPARKGELLFELVADDGITESAPAAVAVYVKNNVPVAEAGSDQNVAGGSQVTLSGTASSDVDGDELTYLWTQVEGPTVTLSDPAAAKPSFVAPASKSALVFELVVDDGESSSAPDTVLVSVANNTPVADAGPDQTVAASANVMLDGSASFDVDDDPLDYEWTQLAGAPVVLDDAYAAQPSFVAPDSKDELVFELVACDGTVCSQPDKVKVHVANSPPVADAGPDQTLAGGELVFLDGSSSYDDDGDALTFEWKQTGGTPVILSDHAAASPTFEAPVPAQTLMFQLVVHDGSVYSGADEVVLKIPNHAPVADAGADLVVEGGEKAVLDGSASYDDDKDPLTWTWEQVDGAAVTLSDPHAIKPTFVAPVPRDTLVFSLVVDDGQVTSVADEITVTVPNHAPTADAGADQTVESNVKVVLDGAASSDLDEDGLTWTWTQVDGPEVELTGADTAAPSFVAPSYKTSLTFELVVDDGIATSAADLVVIGVANNAPVADAGPQQEAGVNQTVTLDGTGSADADGDVITYQWTQLSGTTVSLSDPASPTPSFKAPLQPQKMEFELVVDDGVASSEPSVTTVIVGNLAPEANAGPDQEVDGGTVVQLDATGSTDPNGDQVSYFWQQIGGSTVFLSSLSSPTPTFTAPVPREVLSFRVRVTDPMGEASTDIVEITIRNHAPTADAGPGQTVDGGTQVQLDGSSSSDVDGDTLTYHWKQVQGEPVVLSDKNDDRPTFTAPAKRQALVFELLVDDGIAQSAVDIVTIQVDNNAPVASAGPDQCRAPGVTVTLDGSASSDIDGDPMSYQWTQISGPTVVINDGTSATAWFTSPSTIATLRFKLVVSDSFESSEPDVTEVVVSSLCD